MKKLFTLTLILLGVFLHMQFSFCGEFRELTEREQKIYRQYREDSDAILDDTAITDKNMEIDKLIDKLAAKYNITHGEMDDIISRGWKQDFYELFLSSDDPVPQE